MVLQLHATFVGLAGVAVARHPMVLPRSLAPALGHISNEAAHIATYAPRLHICRTYNATADATGQQGLSRACIYDAADRSILQESKVRTRCYFIYVYVS